jgi:hypothetical protein
MLFPTTPRGANEYNFLEKMGKEAVVASFKTLSRHSHRET